MTNFDTHPTQATYLERVVEKTTENINTLRGILDNDITLQPAPAELIRQAVVELRGVLRDAKGALDESRQRKAALERKAGLR